MPPKPTGKIDDSLPTAPSCVLDMSAVVMPVSEARQRELKEAKLAEMAAALAESAPKDPVQERIRELQSTTPPATWSENSPLEYLALRSDQPSLRDGKLISLSRFAVCRVGLDCTIEEAASFKKSG
ncbi:MAG: hypothetical protein ACHRXM_40415, partial [Isosphaerales bacterium]